MKNEQEFRKNMQEMRQEMQEHETTREQLIRHARTIQKNAKSAIFAIQRDQKDKAKELLSALDPAVKDLCTKYTNTPYMHTINPALEEYAEGKMLYVYITEEKMLTQAALNIPKETYIGALSDFTGELVRLCYAESFKQNIDFIKKTKIDIDTLYEELLQMECKGDLRRKFDAIKYNIQKIEHLLFELNIAHMRK